LRTPHELDDSIPMNLLFFIVTRSAPDPTHTYYEIMMMLEQFLDFNVIVRLEQQQRGHPHLHVLVSSLICYIMVC
jgi:hypothetical protein